MDCKLLYCIFQIEQVKVKPGVHTIVFESYGPASVVVTGSTLVTFRHGFSTFKPAFLKETATKPIPGMNKLMKYKESQLFKF